MKRIFSGLAIAAGLACVVHAVPPAADKSGQAAVLTVPTPAEFFAALDKAVKPDWASFYREQVPTVYSVRPLAAVNLGALVADGYLAVEAQDGQQVKNTGKDIITLARALGVGEHVLARGKSIGDFADKNDWSALKEELDATTNEVRFAMAEQHDEGLGALIIAGAWVRALHVGGRAAELSGEAVADELLSQAGLLAVLRADLEKLPEKDREVPVVKSTREVLATLEGRMKVAAGGQQAADIVKIAGDFVTDVARKK